MGYHLIENENPNARLRDNGKKGNYYPKRSRAIQGIVVHTAEGGKNALGIAKYLASTDRTASAHVVIDDENIVDLLPDDYTAFHVRGHNSKSLGLEIAYYASEWGTDKEYEDAVIKLSAKWCADQGASQGPGPDAGGVCPCCGGDILDRKSVGEWTCQAEQARASRA